MPNGSSGKKPAAENVLLMGGCYRLLAWGCRVGAGGRDRPADHADGALYRQSASTSLISHFRTRTAAPQPKAQPHVYPSAPRPSWLPSTRTMSMPLPVSRNTSKGACIECNRSTEQLQPIRSPRDWCSRWSISTQDHVGGWSSPH